MSHYKNVEQFVKESFEKAGDDHGFKHLVRTVHWVKELKPNSDEALLIAAIAHDIERAYGDHDKMSKALMAKGFRNDYFLDHHQAEGANIIAKFLESRKAGQELIERVKMLIGNHEIGGNTDQNILKDADSISFFENNIDHFIDVKAKEIGRDKVKEKFDWMYSRISSDKARQIALGWYNDAIARL
jgi:hypothetical protein